MVYIVYAMYAVYRSLPPVVRGGWTGEPTPYPPIPLGGGPWSRITGSYIYIYLYIYIYCKHAYWNMVCCFFETIGVPCIRGYSKYCARTVMRMLVLSRSQRSVRGRTVRLDDYKRRLRLRQWLGVSKSFSFFLSDTESQSGNSQRDLGRWSKTVWTWQLVLHSLVFNAPASKYIRIFGLDICCVLWNLQAAFSAAWSMSIDAPPFVPAALQTSLLSKFGPCFDGCLKHFRQSK